MSGPPSQGTQRSDLRNRGLGTADRLEQGIHDEARTNFHEEDGRPSSISGRSVPAPTGHDVQTQFFPTTMPIPERDTVQGVRDTVQGVRDTVQRERDTVQPGQERHYDTGQTRHSSHQTEIYSMRMGQVGQDRMWGGGQVRSNVERDPWHPRREPKELNEISNKEFIFRGGSSVSSEFSSDLWNLMAFDPKDTQAGKYNAYIITSWYGVWLTLFTGMPFRVFTIGNSLQVLASIGILFLLAWGMSRQSIFGHLVESCYESFRLDSEEKKRKNEATLQPRFMDECIHSFPQIEIFKVLADNMRLLSAFLTSLWVGVVLGNLYFVERAALQKTFHSILSIAMKCSANIRDPKVRNTSRRMSSSTRNTEIRRSSGTRVVGMSDIPEEVMEEKPDGDYFTINNEQAGQPFEYDEVLAYRMTIVRYANACFRLRWLEACEYDEQINNSINVMRGSLGLLLKASEWRYIRNTNSRCQMIVTWMTRLVNECFHKGFISDEMLADLQDKIEDLRASNEWGVSVLPYPYVVLVVLVVKVYMCAEILGLATVMFPYFHEKGIEFAEKNFINTILLMVGSAIMSSIHIWLFQALLDLYVLLRNPNVGALCGHIPTQKIMQFVEAVTFQTVMNHMPSSDWQNLVRGDKEENEMEHHDSVQSTTIDDRNINSIAMSDAISSPKLKRGTEWSSPRSPGELLNRVNGVFNRSFMGNFISFPKPGTDRRKKNSQIKKAAAAGVR